MTITFVYLSQVESWLDEGGPVRQTKTKYVYGSYGNLTREEQHGDTSILTDDKTIHRGYYPNTSAWIVDKLAWENVYQTITDNVGGVNLKTQTIYYYDGQTSYTASPIKGKVTAILRGWAGQPGYYTGYQYDSNYGNRTAVIDPRGMNGPTPATPEASADQYRTLTTYDSTYQTYPVTIRGPNPPAHTTTLAYDWQLGKVTSVTDPNSQVTSYQYDTLGRLTKVIRPGDSPTYPTIQYEYLVWAGAVITPVIEINTYRRETSDTGNTLWKREFYDGFGRLVQTQTEDDGNNNDLLSYIIYDNRGLKVKESVPYTVQKYVWNGQSPYKSPDLAKPQTGYGYDALGRTISITNTDGTVVSKSYTSWVTTVIDEKLHKKAYTNDAYGQLAKVEEYTGAGTYTLYATTTYGYDVLSHLVAVTDTVGSVITMTYDTAGRKTSMKDPDMGIWTYGYDSAGNLTSQTDAKGQTITFVYDGMSRLTSKSYSGTTVTYTYDQGTYGKGRRTRMDYSSGYTTWVYDGRGRVVTETQVISGTGGGTFVTQYAYDAMDRVTSMTYPDNEQVNTTYNTQGLPETLGGTSTYVGSTVYNARGQTTQINLGSGVNTQYAYWGDTAGEPTNFRLKSLVTSSSLQNLSFRYDNVGNVLAITDTLAGPQVQNFTYDDLDRLTGVSGAYTQTYQYSGNDGKIGNITNFAGTAYDYSDAAHKHAVTHLGGAQKFWYDTNGNMLRRIENGATYFQAWDRENRLESVITDIASVHLVYNGDGQRIRKTDYTNLTASLTDSFNIKDTSNWTFNGQQIVPFDDGGQNVVKSTGTDADWNGNFYRNANSLTSGESASIDFKVAVTNTYSVYALESDPSSTDRWGVIADQGKLYVQYRANGGTWTYPKDLLNPLKTNTWYRLTLRVDDANGFKIEVRERDGGTDSASYSYAMPGGKSWRFHHWIYRNIAYLDNYVERADSASSTIYIGNYYEKTGSSVTKYYYFGGQRVAMRTTAGVTYIHSDHLGSTNVTSGAQSGSIKYFPYGATRSGAVVTAYKFTGQVLDSGIALYYYSDSTSYGRYYNPEIGRWAQPDTLIPDYTNPQDLNRYSYVKNNPVRYTDPDGHIDVQEYLDLLRQALAGSRGSGAGSGGSGLGGFLGSLGKAVIGFAQSVGSKVAELVNKPATEGDPKTPEMPAGSKTAESPKGTDVINKAPSGRVTDALETGKRAHRDFANRVETKPGWQSEPRLTDPATGRTVIPDAITPTGRPVELKPDTPSGRAQGARQLPRYERATGEKGRVIYYDPSEY